MYYHVIFKRHSVSKRVEFWVDLSNLVTAYLITHLGKNEYV